MARMPGRCEPQRALRSAASGTRRVRAKAPKPQDESRRQLAMLVRVFGKMRLDEIEPADVSDYFRARSTRQKNDKGKMVGGAIAATRDKALLSAVFNFARANRLTNASNPCAGIRGKKSHREIYVTDEELAKVLEYSDAELAAFLEIAYRTGA